MDTHAEHLSKHDQASGHPSPRARTVLAIGIGLYLLVLGGLGGTLAERIRFDLRREPVLARYDALLRARNAGLMAIELDSAQPSGPARGDLAPVPSGTRTAAAGN